jgi:hypothetical protein
MSELRVHHDEEVGTVLVVTRLQRARKEYQCDDCSGPIAQGEVYRYRWSICDGSGLTERYHGLCGPW